MTTTPTPESFARLSHADRVLLTILAFAGTTESRVRLFKYLSGAEAKTAADVAYSAASLNLALTNLQAQGFVCVDKSGNLGVPPDLWAVALHEATADGNLPRYGNAVQRVDKLELVQVRMNSGGYLQKVRALRKSLLLGCDETVIQGLLRRCQEHDDYFRQHPYLSIFPSPLNVPLFKLLHPLAQEEVLSLLVRRSWLSFDPVAPLRQCARDLCTAPGRHLPEFVPICAELALLCGELDEAAALLASQQGAVASALRSGIALFKGDLAGALAGFEAALKAYRLETGARTALLDGMSGYLHVLALLRSDDDKQQQKARTLLTAAERNSDNPTWGVLAYLCEVQAGRQPAGYMTDPSNFDNPFSGLIRQMVGYWLGQPHHADSTALLLKLARQCDAAGFQLITVQIVALLQNTPNALKDPALAELVARAASLRAQQGMVAMTDWFARQEPWERQLAALAKLNAGDKGADNSSAQSRLVWELDLLAGQVHLAPREQKRKGKAGWTGGRAVALKRLSEEADTLDFLTAQDRQVCSNINRISVGYYGSFDYQIDGDRALPLLIGHPLVFFGSADGPRMEILRGELELEIKKTAGDTLTLSLRPSIGNDSPESLFIRETPTRLRVIQITPEHRHIGQILGKSLKVPARAKEQVLGAIRTISSLITIQSDIDVLPSHAEQVPADPRLHLHLMPYADGLRVTLLVRPFANAGPYYAPGAGADSVIADIAGQPMQARRNLTDETSAASSLVANCPALRDAIETHGERLIEEPENCLELLLQLQAQGDKVLIAWPEGEKFKVSRELGASRFSMSINRNLDWFSVTGELQVDDSQVLDLQKLLALTAAGHGRFIHLGDNQFLALTDEFRRRLDELRAFSDPQGKGVRIHPLAAGALQELADSAGKLKSDKHWKDHLARLSALDDLRPVLPATLQAELRDYQLTGFNWLARLAHWGVGACLADDMGLGKTLQALALLLDRAPHGPALVVAPTSVCMNWLGEVARFAPTLNVLLFGSGDRQLALTGLKPFDLVVASYGLLQQETELFTAVPWHTIVLDEAQAIKNHATKRSQAAMALQGDFRLICSGTPLENHLGELWNLFRFINPGLLGSLEQFNERYAGPIERQQDVGARNRLRKLIAPFMLRRTKSQVLTELPSRTEILRQVELSKEEAALYEALRREALDRLASTEGNPGQRHIEILAEIMKLRRACCNPNLVAPALGLPSSKLAAFGQLLDELVANRHKALVFSQFVDHLSLTRAELDARGVRYQYLDGATPMQQRKVRVDAFQAGDGDVFLISLKAGGTGLNLTAADYVIHMDPWWNPAVEDQASDRAHRIGQTRPVTIYRLVAQQTIEEKIVDLHKTKRALADSLLEGSDLAARMSADDILALLKEEWRAEAAPAQQ